jgi:hypothetical protein
MRTLAIPPIRRYSPGDRLYVQAQRIWLILAAFVSGMTRGVTDRQTLTYGELALRMGYEDARAGHVLGRQLGIVGNYCVMNGLPPLNVIVVDQETNQPGSGVVVRPGRTVRQEQRAVHQQDWFEVGVPSTGTLRKVWEQM